MNKEEKIKSILESLNGMERSAPRPFFFTRLEARLQKRYRTSGVLEVLVNFLSKPVVAAAAVMLIITINAYALFFTTPQSSEGQASAASVTELASVDEYVQLSPDFFDFEKSYP